MIKQLELQIEILRNASMKINLNTIMATVFAVLVSLLLAGCGGSSSDTSSGGSSGNLNIYLTDAPTDEVSSVNVYIRGLTVKRSGASVDRISDDVGLIDLLTLENSTQLIAEANVQPGNYEFIMVELDQGRSNVVVKSSGNTVPLKIPSKEIKVLGGFVVDSEGLTEVVLDFDADKSLNKLGNDNWLLNPVIVKK
jgi:hypothetical protein